MPVRLGTTVPMVELMRELPVASMAGCVLATAPNGTARYIYGLFPSSNTAATFYRFDTYYNVWEQLTSPTLAVSDLLLTACAMVVDGTTGEVYLFNSRNANPNYHRFQQYTPNSDSWAQVAPAAPNDLETVAVLAAAWTTGASLCHPCTTAGAPVSDNFIYLVGNAGTAMYIFDMTGPTWAAAAGAARTGASGAGVTLDWLPEQPDLVFSMRGNNTANCDVYSIAGGAFAAPTLLLPATTLFTTGTETCADTRRNRIIMQINGQFYEIGPISALNLRVTPVANYYGTQGTPHLGRGIVSARVGNQSYIYGRKQTRSEFQRLEVIE